MEDTISDEYRCLGTSTGHDEEMQHGKETVGVFDPRIRRGHSMRLYDGEVI